MERKTLHFIDSREIMTNEYPIYAHTGNGEKELLEEHIHRCEFYFEKLYQQKEIEKIIRRFCESFQFENEDAFFYWMRDLMFQIIVFHDLGKCNPDFQRMNMKNAEAPESYEGLSGKHHSFLSSIFYLDYFFEKLEQEDRFNNNEKKKMYIMIGEHAFLISRHHSDIGKFGDYRKQFKKKENERLLDNLKKKPMAGYRGLRYTKDHTIAKTLCLGIYKGKKKFTREESILKYFYYRLVYSLLVASDYHATSEYMNNIKKSDLGEALSIDVFKKSYEKSEILKSIRKYENEKYEINQKHLDSVREMNDLRSQLFLDAERELKKHMDQSLFFLEAPTGSGKSNTAMQLSFHLMDNGKKLLYIYPFNTLVEQNLQSMKKLFPDENLRNQIVVVNSLTPISDAKNCIADEATEHYYQNLLLDRQFLNYPIILSTHVSFFNLLFGENKEDIFGFFQLSDAVIVLDEIQSYRNSIWSEIIIFLQHCAKLMGMKIIIMSATLPDLGYLSVERKGIVQLINHRDDYFKHPIFQNRVKLSFELLEDKITQDQLLNHLIQHKKEERILIEFIRKDSAYQFYQKLLGCPEIECPVSCLTGDDSIYEREQILAPIKNGSMNNMILVATQVVEAGVDIDMDKGYKNISLLDSEEQFLGRINRSCKRTGIVYFFDMDSSQMIYRDDFRNDRKFTLKNLKMHQLLMEKNFSQYYAEIFASLQENLNQSTDEKGLNTFFEKEVQRLDYPDVADRMQLIKKDNWSMDIVLCRNLEFEDGTILNGQETWESYKRLLQNQELSYEEKQIKLSEVRSKLAYFTYQIKRNSQVPYNDVLGELRCIFDGEQYFENGKLNRNKFEAGGALFIDL